MHPETKIRLCWHASKCLLVSALGWLLISITSYTQDAPDAHVRQPLDDAW